jgi:TM2 domain-containing membrane protein YozV
MFCRNCGKEIMNNEPFCSACGTAVEGFVQAKTTNNVYSADQKSRIAAGLLGIFLGCYGVHNFYLGYTAKAVIQLVSTIIGYVLSCIFIGYFIIAGIGIWVLIESIMIFAGSINVDAKGVPLKD